MNPEEALAEIEANDPYLVYLDSVHEPAGRYLAPSGRQLRSRGVLEQLEVEIER